MSIPRTSDEVRNIEMAFFGHDDDGRRQRVNDIANSVARLETALNDFEAENDFCLVCQEHPSSGHNKKCPMNRDEGVAR